MAVTPNSTEHYKTLEKSNLRNEVRALVLETAKRYPGQELSKENLQATLEDWTVLASEVGFPRFRDGVIRTWQYSEFFPKPKHIRELIPPARLPDGERWNRELRDLEQRKRNGERFWTLGDVFMAVAEKILNQEIRPSDPGWIEWAKHFKASAK